MQIIRIIKNDNYTIISNDIFRDTDLSAKGRGLLCTLLSLPPEWDLSINGIVAIMKEGKDAVMSGFNELIDNGYIIRNRVRIKGKYKGYEYIVYETKITPKSDNPNTEHPNTGKPDTEYPNTEKPDTENPTQLNNDTIKYLNNQVINKEKDFFKKPLLDDVIFFVKEQGNIIDAKQFFNHYESNGWRIGKNKMEDWKAAVRSWESRAVENGAKTDKVATRLKSHQEAKALLKSIHNGNQKN